MAISSLRWWLSVWLWRWTSRLGYLLTAPRIYKNWWALPLPKLGVGVVLRLRNGLQYLVRAGTTDLSVVNEISTADPYAVFDLAALPPNAVVLDVGANVGAFAIKAARALPRGRVYAVEPVAEHVAMIEIQKRLNAAENLTALHLALGGRDGQVNIHLAGTQSSIVWQGQGGRVETVRLATLGGLLDELAIERLDLLKLDCEGAEWDILLAAEAALSRVERLVMEFHLAGDWTAEKLADWLTQRGYQVRYTPGGWNGMLWACRPLTEGPHPATGAPSPLEHSPDKPTLETS